MCYIAAGVFVNYICFDVSQWLIWFGMFGNRSCSICVWLQIRVQLLLIPCRACDFRCCRVLMFNYCWLLQTICTAVVYWYSRFVVVINHVPTLLLAPVGPDLIGLACCLMSIRFAACHEGIAMWLHYNLAHLWLGMLVYACNLNVRAALQLAWMVF